VGSPKDLTGSAFIIMTRDCFSVRTDRFRFLHAFPLDRISTIAVTEDQSCDLASDVQHM
jgi:hypothetical protein